MSARLALNSSLRLDGEKESNRRESARRGRYGVEHVFVSDCSGRSIAAPNKSGGGQPHVFFCRLAILFVVGVLRWGQKVNNSRQATLFMSS